MQTDSDYGFVAVEEIHNVWVESMRRLREEVIPSGSQVAIEALFDDFRLELFKRARANLEEVLRRNPAALRNPDKEKAEAAAEQEAQRNRETWEARVARGRAHAFNDQRGK